MQHFGQEFHHMGRLENLTMKKTRHLLKTLAVSFMAFIACSCDSNIFRDSSKGLMSVSFRADGVRYECSERSSFYAYTDTLGNTFSLKSRCRSDLHSGIHADLSISIDLDTLQVISPEKDYQITPFIGTEDAADEKEYVRIAIGNMYAKSGWIRFRSFKGRQASGNFEFTFEDDDMVEHTVLYGNFDANAQY